MMSSNSSVSSVVTYKSASSSHSRRARWSRSQPQNPPPAPMRQRLLRFGRNIYNSRIARVSSSSSSMVEHDADRECDPVVLARRKSKINTRSIAELDDDDDEDEDDHDYSGGDIFGSDEEEDSESDDDNEETRIVPPPSVIRSTNVLTSNFLFLLLLRSEQGDETMEIKRVSVDTQNETEGSLVSSLCHNEGSIILPSLEYKEQPDDNLLCDKKHEEEATNKVALGEGSPDSLTPAIEPPDRTRGTSSRNKRTRRSVPTEASSCIPENVVTIASNVKKKGMKGATPYNLLRRMASCTCQVDDGSVSSRTAPSSLPPQEDDNKSDDENDDSSHEFIVTFQEPLVTETWIASTSSMLSHEEKEDLFYGPEDYEDFRMDALYGDFEDDGFMEEAYCGNCNDGFHAVMSSASCVETVGTSNTPSLLARIARASSPTPFDAERRQRKEGRRKATSISVMGFFSGSAASPTSSTEEDVDFWEVCRDTETLASLKKKARLRLTVVKGES